MNLIDDLRYAFRVLSKSPGFSLLTLLILSLGLGSAISGFGVLHAIVLKPLPFDDAHELVHLERAILERDLGSLELTWDDFNDWREMQTSFEDIGAFYTGTVNIRGAEKPERFDGGFMSDGSFEIVGIEPLLGRTFRETDAMFGAPDVIILGYDVWQRTFNGDPDIIGELVRANGADAEVIGVMPEGVEFPLAEDVWVPLRFDEANRKRGDGITLEGFGRLKDDVSIDRARAEFASITAQLEEAYPETSEGVTAVIKPFAHEYVGEDTRKAIWTMMVAVTLVLLIACANVANLLLSRTSGRTQEVAIRAAVGAGRGRLIMQMLFESLLLALGGAVIGLILAYWSIMASDRFFGEGGTGLPFWVVLELDSRSAVFAICAAVFTALIAGLVPALRASGININGVLREGAQSVTSRQGKWLSQSLVVVEIALSFILLTLAALTIQSSLELQEHKVGARTDSLLTARIGLPQAEYPEEERQARFFLELNNRLAEMRGVSAASVTGGLPGTWGGNWTPYLPEGKQVTDDERSVWVPFVSVAPGYFDAFEAPLLQGRDFDDSDTADSLPVVIVNQYYVENEMAGRDPVGSRVRFTRPGDEEQPEDWRTIVGVSQDIRQTGVNDNQERSVFWVPISQVPVRFASVALRTSGDPLRMTPALRDTVQQLDPDLPLYWVRTLEQTYETETAPNRLLGIYFGAFAVIALFLAAGGTYGVISFNVNQRTPEFGIRRALGANDQNILRIVSRQALDQLGIGLGLGIVGAYGAAQVMQSLLIVPVDNPAVFIGVGLLLVAAVVIACVAPTLRAMRIEPMAALRYE